MEDEVDLERLRRLLLPGVHAVARLEPHAEQAEPIREARRRSSAHHRVGHAHGPHDRRHVVDAHDVGARAATASATVAAVPSTRSSGAAPSSSSPRNRLRLVPTSTGRPPRSAFSSPSRWSSSRFSLVPFPKPMPGSTMSRSRATPRAMCRLDGVAQPVHDGRRTPRRGSRSRPGCASARGARPRAAAASAVPGSRRAAHTSLTMVAPASSAAAATAPLLVSMLIRRPVAELGRQRAHDRHRQRRLGLRVDRRDARRRPGAAGSTRRRRPGCRRRPSTIARPWASAAATTSPASRPAGRQPIAGEGVGRDVDDAHHVRPLAPAQLGCHHSSSAVPVIMPRTAPTR